MNMRFIGRSTDSKFFKRIGYLCITGVILMTACGRQKNGTENKKIHSPAVTLHHKNKHLSPRAKRGLLIAKQNGCFNCHSTNGASKTGPTFKGFYGRTVTLKDSSTTKADSSYIVESLHQPNVKITAGYYPVMPKYNHLTDREVQALIAYIKSLRKQRDVKPGLQK